MNNLAEGVKKFHRDVHPWNRGLFEKLADGQSPHTLFITCGDSRIAPCLLTQSEPGELFVVRNAGNLVPRAEGDATGEQASIEFAVTALGVKRAVICGHSSCGAMAGLLNPARVEGVPLVDSWLRHARPVLERINPQTVTIEEAAKANVLVQLENLRTLPPAAAAVDKGELELIGWYYDIRSGVVEQYNADSGKFAAIG
ncbi:MAG: carbonic anhydrase [Aeoliella sp.]